MNNLHLPFYFSNLIYLESIFTKITAMNYVKIKFVVSPYTTGCLEYIARFEG